MADTQQDKPAERTARARMNRIFGTGEEHGYLRIYAQEYAKSVNDITDYAPPALYLGGLFLAAAGALLGFGGGSLYTSFNDEYGTPETSIAQGVQAGDHYSAIEIDNETYALFKIGDRYRLYSYDGDKLTYLAPTGGTIDLGFKVSESLQEVVTALEKGERPVGTALPTIQEFTGLTEAFTSVGSRTVREVEAARPATSDTRSYLSEIAAIHADWVAAKDQMINGNYGFTKEQSRARAQAPDVESYPVIAAWATGGLVYGGLMLWPLAAAGTSTAARVSRSRRAARQNKR